MSQLLNWSNIVVPQRNESGCVPTGYEWLIRYLGIQGVNLTTFQDDFDLGIANNNFNSVANKIQTRYPQIKIQTKDYANALDKVNAITSLLQKQVPCLISLALAEIQGDTIVHKGWHIMPVVYIDSQKIKMIHDATLRGNNIWDFPLKEIIWRHQNLRGGKDIAWITV